MYLYLVMSMVRSHVYTMSQQGRLSMVLSLLSPVSVRLDLPRGILVFSLHNLSDIVHKGDVQGRRVLGSQTTRNNASIRCALPRRFSTVSEQGSSARELVSVCRGAREHLTCGTAGDVLGTRGPTYWRMCLL